MKRRRGAVTYLFSCSWLHLSVVVSSIIRRNLILSSFKEGVLVRNGYFSPMRSMSVTKKQDFFQLFLWTKFMQNIFSFYKIESWVYSIFQLILYFQYFNILVLGMMYTKLVWYYCYCFCYWQLMSFSNFLTKTEKSSKTHRNSS